MDSDFTPEMRIVVVDPRVAPRWRWVLRYKENGDLVSSTRIFDTPEEAEVDANLAAGAFDFWVKSTIGMSCGSMRFGIGGPGGPPIIHTEEHDGR